MGKVYHKCGCENHFENVCGRIPFFRGRSKSQSQKQVNELRKDRQGSTSMSSSGKFMSDNSKTVPKQVVDIVDVINQNQSSGKNLRRFLELDTLSTTSRTVQISEHRTECSTECKTANTSATQIFSNINMNGVIIRGKQDTGAEINAMPLNIYDQLNQKLKGKLELKPCDKVRVIGYSKQSVEIVGKVSVTCTHTTTIKKVNFYITNLVDTKVILGLQFCRAFNLVSVNCSDNCVCKEVAVEALNAESPRGLDPAGSTMQNRLPPPLPVNVNTKLRPDCKQHILELFPELFDGIGTMKDAEVILDVNPDIEPVVQPPHKIPQAMVKPLKCEIDRMLELGVIHKLDINEATDWVNNLVLVRKPNGKLRVCLDPRTINKVLRFNVHNSRTFQDISSSIRGVKKISKIDANSGFWTLPMSQESQLLTTFNTPWGRFCFVKMSFGLNQVQYFFQYYMDINFHDINPTTNIIANDVMIHGNTDEEHDHHLIQVSNKCHEIGLKLNPGKCEFGKSEITFYGNIVSNQVFKLDPCKVDVIVRMPAPTNKTELCSFLGMVNYLAPHIPKLSDCTAVLRQLNKKNADFTWNTTYEKAFRNAKLHVANAVTLKFFDPDKDVVIECDAPGAVIGGTLLEDGHPVTFISQALTSM